MTGAADLVVVVNGFPRLSETFVLQELLDLERRGLRLHVVALSAPGEIVRQEDMQRLQATVEHLPLSVELSGRTVARAHARLLRANGQIHAARLLKLTRSPDYTPGAKRRALVLAARVAELGAPPMYIHWAHRPATIGRFAAKLAGVRYALSCHAKDIWLTPAEELSAKVRDAEVVLTCTDLGRQELERHTRGATPVVLAHHGVDVDQPAPSPPASGPARIVTVGRLVQKKGHDTLIRAAAILAERGADFRLRIVGEGAEWPSLQRLVHSLGVHEHVIFLGPLSPAEVRAEYGAASAFALACRVLSSGDRDGIPNVLLEAMAHGLPVVTTTQSGTEEAVNDGSSGLLVPPDDPDALAGALERVLQDKELAARLGTVARTTIRQRFDRNRLLPTVAAALANAGLISPAAAAVPPAGHSAAAVEQLVAA